MNRGDGVMRAGMRPGWRLWLSLGGALACVLAGSANAQSHVVFRDTRSPQTIAPEALLRDLLAGSAPLVIDVRSEVQFERGHIPGAMNVPIKQLAGRWEEFVPYRDLGIVLYCQKGGVSQTASHILGVEKVRKIGLLDGYFHQWERRGYPVARSPE